MSEIRVLMASMFMDIGGAETHVLELCKAVAKKGVKVYVVSLGGRFVEELEKNGIKHFVAPLHSKKITDMIKSYKIIRRIVAQNDINIIHAHARIPAFLCGIAAKRMKVRFVTTVHQTFNTSFPYRILTNWGEKTFSVSEDLKQYLTKNYKVDEKNVKVTINGIDTEKFAENKGKNGFVVINVSRMDTDMTAPTHALLSCATEWAGKYQELSIIIIGGGNDLKNVEKKAEDINRQIGRKVVQVLGARSDINLLLSKADVFVGVSRSALEAAACGLPVVLAGNQGYMGILDEDTLGVGISTNFCGRGLRGTTVELVKADVERVLDASKEERERLGKFGRELIVKNYSAERMAGDTVEIYEKMRRPKKAIDVVVSGYYGSQNHGDDSLLAAITADLRGFKGDVEICALSRLPKNTQKVYGIGAVQSFNLLKVWKVLGETNLLISGGGTLVQDVTSSQSLLYYLLIMRLARLRGAKVMLYANGIGPVRHNFNRKIARKVLNDVDLITLRDTDSLKELEEMGIDVGRVKVTADAVFGIKWSGGDKCDEILEKNGIKDEKYVIVNVREWKYLKNDFCDEMCEFLSYVSEKYDICAYFLPMQKNIDMNISCKIVGKLKGKSRILENNLEIDEILAIMQRAEFVVSMRLHALIYAAKAGTPFVGLVYDPKVSSLVESFGQRFYCDLKEMSAGELKGFADEILANRVEISEILLKESEKLAQKASENAALAFEIIDRKIF